MDETRQFISKQNVSLIAEMSQQPFTQARQLVIDWVRKHNGFIPSASQANESLLADIQGFNMNQRPLQTSSMKQHTSASVDDRMRQMQQERDGLFSKPPPSMPPRTENTLVQKMSMEEREEMTKQTSQRLEQMQRERQIPIAAASPAPAPATTPAPSVAHTYTSASPTSMYFHSPYAEAKKAGDWWDCEWVIPEIYTMALASHLEIPYITIRTKQRSGLRRLLVLVKNVKGGGETVIVTPNQQKLEGVVTFEVKQEVHDSVTGLWQYHLSPVSSSPLIWNQKTERVEVQLRTIGRELGRFWDKEEVESWSILIQWYRPG